jgi:hypothetical protein
MIEMEPRTPAEALTRSRFNQAVENIDELNTSISLDRSTYFAGEVAKITIRVENPTDKALEIPDPRQSLYFNVACLGEPYAHCGMADWVATPGDNTPLLTLQPGGVIEFTVLSSDQVPGSSELTVEPGGTVPIRVGQARFHGFWGQLDFDVVAPKLIQIVRAKFTAKAESSTDEPQQTANGSQTVGAGEKTVDRYINAMVLESASERAIVISQKPRQWIPHIRGTQDRPLNKGDVEEIFPFYRIATVSGPVQNLQISLPKGTEELIEVRWQEGNQKHVIALDKQHNPIQQ